MLKTWRECRMCQWTLGSLVIGERRHKMTWAMPFRGKERSSAGSQREQRSSLTNSGTTESRSGATTSRQLKHWRERLRKPAKKGVRLYQRDRRWKKVSPTDHRACGGARCQSGQDTEGCT